MHTLMDSCACSASSQSLARTLRSQTIHAGTPNTPGMLFVLSGKSSAAPVYALVTLKSGQHSSQYRLNRRSIPSGSNRHAFNSSSLRIASARAARRSVSAFASPSACFCCCSCSGVCPGALSPCCWPDGADPTPPGGVLPPGGCTEGLGLLGPDPPAALDADTIGAESAGGAGESSGAPGVGLVAADGAAEGVAVVPGAGVGVAARDAAAEGPGGGSPAAAPSVAAAAAAAARASGGTASPAAARRCSAR